MRGRSPGRQPLSTPLLSGKPPGRRGNVLQGTEALPGDQLLGAGQEEAEFSYGGLARDHRGQTACPDRAGPSPGSVLPKSQTGPSSRPWASPDTGMARPGPSPSFSLLSADPTLRPRPPLAPCGLSPRSRPPWVAVAEVKHRDLERDVSLC